MSRLVRPGPGFDELFSSFGRSAWRFETQPAYHVDAEQQAMRRYLNSGELDVSYLTGWLDGVREATRQGKRYARVRVLTEPLTDYLRFEMAVAPYNIAAGEDIRVLSPAQASELALPDYDYWLFDDEWLAIMHFGRPACAMPKSSPTQRPSSSTVHGGTRLPATGDPSRTTLPGA